MKKLVLSRPLGAAFLLLLALLSALPGRAQSVLAQWPLTSSYTATVAAGVAAPPTTPTLSGVVVTTSGPAIGYSALGQGTAPNADGTGWTGTISSTRYQEFPLTIAPGYAGRVDSILFSTAINNTTSGRLAVAYSTDNFATSTFIVGSISGTTITGVAINNVTQITGTNSTYSKIAAALNNSAGLVLPAGGRVAFRLYYSVGSASARPAELKTLTIRGQVATVGSVATTSAQVSFNVPSQGSSTYTITTNPAGGTATQTTAPTSSNGYVAVYTITGLTAATAYTATVATSTVYGGAAVATTITSPSFTTASAACPNVSNVTVSSITQTGASVSFTPGSGNTAFVVTYTPSGGSTTTVSPNPTSSPVALSGLTGGTAYTVTVQSVCASGSGAAQSAAFTTLTCADPTALAVSNVTGSSASLSFTPGSGNSNYTVAYYPTGSPGSIQTVSPVPTASPVVLTGLTPATAYTVTLQSTCTNGAVGNVLTRTFTTRLASSPVLQQWPLTSSASDDPAVRSAGVTASTATLSNMALANGTANSEASATFQLQPYSALGQGIAPNADGTGWNGTVRPTYYEEFAVTAATGGSVRVDSLIFSAGGFGSTMNLSVAYSTDGFATAGNFILGSQASPVALNKVSSSGYSVLRLPLTGPAGVTLAAGGTVAFRLYYALGTSSTRYALTKNLYVTGVATATCPAATALSISNLTAVGAQLNFTPGSGNTSYLVTLTPQGGSASTVTPAPTASPVVFTGLDASTTYTVTLQTSCSGTPGYVQSLSFTTPAASSAVLQQWLLTTDNTDNAALRSYAATASTPTFSGLLSSTNTTASTPPVPAYSATYGQALAPAGNGGSWSSSLSSTVYEEFTLTAAADDNLRIDSLTFSTAFYNTANGRLAVAYSLDGFASSTFVLGTLAAPVTANNYNSVGFATYRLALGGLTRASGQTLSVRLYYGAGTSSTGRYALLRNVYFAGEGFVNNLPNLTIGDARSVATSTTYGNVTVLPGGAATLGGPLTAQGAVTVQSGAVLSTNCQPLTGAATFTLAAGAELRVCDPAGIMATAAAGAVQTTGPRSYSPDATYTYTYTYTGTTSGGSNLATGDGLPATVRTLNVSLAAATDTLQLGSNLTVTNALNMTQGILKTYLPSGSPSYVVTMSSGSTTLSETSSSFVLGQVRSATLFFGSDGSNSAFGGIGVRLVAHAAASLPGNTYVLRSTGQPVYGQGTSRSIRRQYRLVPTTDTGLNVDATFTFNPTAAELNGIPAASLQLFSRPIAGGNWTPETATITATTASATALTHLSDWTLSNAANPLPVQLLRFEAARQAAAVLLTWTTASELHNQGFEVQVSPDGREFRRLGFVVGAGSSASAHSYQYVDASAQPGLRYYRLRQLDQDGTATYSATRTVLVAGPAVAALQAAPNPFGGDALTLFTQAANATPATLRLTDALGRVVRTQTLAVPAGPAQLAVTGLADLPAGLYVAELLLDGQPQRLKLVRE